MALFRMKSHYRKRGGGTLSYAGNNLFTIRNAYSGAAAANKNKAMFFGGLSNGTVNKYIQKLDTSFTLSVHDNLYKAVYALAVTLLDDCFIVGGGRGSSSAFYNVARYDNNGSQTGSNNLYSYNNLGLYNLGAASTEDYAIFGGGSCGGSSANYLTAFNKSMTSSTITGYPNVLSNASGNTRGISINGSVVFIGDTGAWDKYDNSLTKVGAISSGAPPCSSNITGITLLNDTYILVRGNDADSDILYIGDSSLTLHTPISGVLKKYMRFPSAESLSGYVIFAGGLFNNSVNNTVEILDASLTKIETSTIIASRYLMFSTVFNNYIIFAGGNNGAGAGLWYADVYQVT